MSPLGSPDFGANQATNPTAPQFDSGEDATRLLMGGGAQARSGRWVYATGFEDGNLASLTTGVAGYTGNTVLDSLKAFQGAASLKMSTLAVINSAAEFEKNFLPPGSRFGMECFFSRGVAAATLHRLDFTMAYRGNQASADSLYTTATIRIIYTNGTDVKLYYRNSSGAFTLITDVAPYFTSPLNNWHYIKFVVDMDTGNYVRLYFDDQLLEMTNTPALTQAAIYPVMTFQVILHALSANQEIYNIDNLILTADEP